MSSPHVPDTTGSDPFDLARFIEAQKDTYEAACRELAAGRKQSHWMWFVFPQMRGLGFSAMAQRYGISSLEEARAYLEHPVLGPRLRRATALVLAIEGRTAHEILGSPDDLKLHSSMTLFHRASEDNMLFQDVLDRYYEGEPDEETLRLIGEGAPPAEGAH